MKFIYFLGPHQGETGYIGYMMLYVRIQYMDVSEHSGFSPPKKHPVVHRVFHSFHHPFWGGSPIFGSTPISTKIVPFLGCGSSTVPKE